MAFQTYKFHRFGMRLSDGQDFGFFYSHRQAQKFILCELLECADAARSIFRPKLDERGQPMTATIAHEHAEFYDVTEPQSKGYKPCLPGQVRPYQKVYVAVQQAPSERGLPNWMYHGGFELVEMTPDIAAQNAGSAEDEAARLEARVKVLRDGVAKNREVVAAK